MKSQLNKTEKRIIGILTIIFNQFFARFFIKIIAHLSFNLFRFDIWPKLDYTAYIHISFLVASIFICKWLGEDSENTKSEV